jgi:photosystem II stability/assembly factor-like uncharacterized protein
VVYIGTFCDGVYKSIDGTENWTKCSTENFPQWEDSLNNSPTLPCWWYGDIYPVQAIGIDPTNSEHLWVGTGGRGLYESKNGGISWLGANNTLPDSISIGSIHIDENIPTKMFLGACAYLGNEYGGLYQTIDGGNKWNLVESVPNGSSYGITCITNTQGNEDHLYVGINSVGEPDFSWGLMESIDGGIEWQIINNEFPIYDLSINPYNNQNMWATIYTGWLDWLSAYTIDGGYTWTADWYNPNPWITSLYADTDYNVYLAEGWEDALDGNVKKSSDNGNTWKYIDSLCAGRGVNLRNRCEANKGNTNNIFFGTYCGVYVSYNGGQNCKLENTGIYNSYIKKIEAHPYKKEIVYAGGNQGLWKSIDGCLSWNQINEEYISSIKFDPKQPDTLYYGGQNFKRSFDGGLTFKDIRNNIVGDIVDISINPKNTNIVYVVSIQDSYMVYKSENYGDTWDQVISRYTANYPYVLIDPSDPDTVYFADYRSIDGGNVWEDVFADEVIGIHPRDSNILYTSNRNTLKVSYDWGDTFQILDTYTNWTVPVPAIGKLVFDNNNPDNIFYCTPNNGIHYTNDAGQNWMVLNGDYEKRTLDVIPLIEKNKIYIATHGAGVWLGENIPLGIEYCSIPSEITLSQNYPNPFNPETTINFKINSTGKVSMLIYNSRGQLVSKLIDEKKLMRGSHTFVWNGKDFSGREASSDVYIIELRVGDNSVSKRMLMVK